MIMKYITKIVKLGKQEYTVVVSCQIDGFVNSEWIMDADRKALNALLVSMAMLLENRNLIIYFPLWHNKIAKDLYRTDDLDNRQQNFDVVFMFHTLQFPIHHWKELRRKLKKIKCSLHTKEINLFATDEKIGRLCDKHKKKDIYFKERDLFDRYFRFDTHFFIGGPYDFAQSYNELRKLLDTPLEHNFCSHYFQNWVAFPQVCSAKNDWLERIEIGFYDHFLRKDHKNAEKNYWKDSKKRMDEILSKSSLDN